MPAAMFSIATPSETPIASPTAIARGLQPE